MVRVKRAVDATKQAEIEEMLYDLKEKFKQDKQDLEVAKRHFSTMYVQEIIKEVESAVPEKVLNMKATDFIHFVKQFGNEERGRKANTNLQTPLQTRRKFTSITTPSGISMQIPSLITPRVDGAVLRSRTSRQGEVLFSMNGTPVTVDAEFEAVNAAEQAKAVQQLLQQNDAEMSPATQKIMQQLRVVLAKKDASTPNDENNSPHASDTTEENY